MATSRCDVSPVFDSGFDRMRQISDRGGGIKRSYVQKGLMCARALPPAEAPPPPCRASGQRDAEAPSYKKT